MKKNIGMAYGWSIAIKDIRKKSIYSQLDEIEKNLSNNSDSIAIIENKAIAMMRGGNRRLLNMI